MPKHSTRPSDAPPRAVPDVASMRRDQRERRDRIVRAAMRLMVEVDYAKLQVRDVAEEADVALGTLYRYFTSKDHLFACALLEWSSGFGGRLDRASGAPTVDRVKDVYRRAARAFEREPRVYDVLVQLQASRDTDTAAVFAEFSRQQTDRVRRRAGRHPLAPARRHRRGDERGPLGGAAQPAARPGVVRRRLLPPRPDRRPDPRLMDEQGRPEPPLAGDEVATLLGFLDYQRATLAWKCAGLDAAGCGATVGASSMTLGGMLKHLAYVEDDWFSGLAARPRAARRRGTRSTGTPTPTGTGTRPPTTPPSSSARSGRTAVARSGRRRRGARRRRPRPARPARTWPDGRAPSLRWILVHMIEEYARHNGHADLLRESIDGQTGE